MHISVVIPIFNRAHTLGRCLESVLRQTSAADEIIVVDDGSADNPQATLADYPTVRVIQQDNQGVSAARNRGIQAARHDWIALLDSDDEWLPRKLERIRDAYRSHPEARLFHSDEIWIRRGVRVNAMNKHQKQGGNIFAACLPLCVISPSASVIHRGLLEEVGLFDTELPACEDYDLWLRVCHRYPVNYLDEALIIKHGGHDDQLSRRYWGMDRFRIRSIHRLLEQGELNAEQHEQAQHILLQKLEILLKGARKHSNSEVIAEFEPLKNRYQGAA